MLKQTSLSKKELSCHILESHSFKNLNLIKWNGAMKNLWSALFFYLAIVNQSFPVKSLWRSGEATSHTHDDMAIERNTRAGFVSHSGRADDENLWLCRFPRIAAKQTSAFHLIENFDWQLLISWRMQGFSDELETVSLIF